jgi:hypothetical protein
MIVLFILSVIIGAIVSGVAGIGFLFWVISAVIFVCGLPFALISSFVRGEVSYAQDRADYRQLMSEIKAEELADEREFAEDVRLDRLVKSSKSQTNIYNDNRQVRVYGVWL